MPRPKPGAVEDPAKLKKKQVKAALYGKLAAEVLGRRRARQYDAESLQLSARLLELNPEVYTVWNYRREAIGPVLEQQASEEARAVVATELALTQKALAANPKSYAAWHHRAWVVVQGGADLQTEMVLVRRLLAVDSRNFHAWSYWRWLTARMQLPAAECLAYTAQQLRENFSNYSAWHARTTLLAAAAAPPRVPTLDEMLAQGSGGATAGAPHTLPSANTGMPDAAAVPAAVLDEEFDLVHKALWTEPKDQSAWLYHRWLLGCCLAAAGISAAVRGPSHATSPSGSSSSSQQQGQAATVLQSRLEREAAMCEELLLEEPEAKWPLLTLTRVKEALAALHLQHPQVCPSRDNQHPQTRRSEDLQHPHTQPAQHDPQSTNQTASEPAPPAPNASEPKEEFQPKEAGGVAAGRSGGAAASTEANAYEQLRQLDPLRSGYYADAAAGLAHVVLRTAGRT